MKIIFFGTSNVALPVLEALRQRHEIIAVVTQPDSRVGKKQVLTESPVSVLAKELQLKCIKPSRALNNNELKTQLQNFDADIFIVVSYGNIISKNILDLPRLKTLNVHFSLLPKYRGASPIQSALLNGDSETGTTIFILDEQLDHGPIIAQKRVNIEPDDTFTTLSVRISRLSAKLLVEILPEYARAKIIPQVQNHIVATRTKLITKAEGKIDWHKTATEIYNQFRAFYEWPQIWTVWRGKKLKILNCVVIDTVTPPMTPGTVLTNGIIICGKNTSLQVLALQLEGKTQTDIKSFLNGYPQFVVSNLA